MDGWIKVYRSFLDWEWFSNPEMVQVFLYLLLNANTEDKQWQGTTIKRGQCVVTRASIKEATELTDRKIRTCLQRLEETKEINKKTTNKFTLVTICKYESYQANTKTERPTNDQQTTSKRPANDQDIRTKEQENILKEKGDSKLSPKEKEKTVPTKAKAEKVPYGEYVLMTNAEYEALTSRFGETPTREMIEILDNYKGAKPNSRKYQSDYRAILSWVAKRWEEENRIKTQTYATNRNVNGNRGGRGMFSREQMDAIMQAADQIPD